MPFCSDFRHRKRLRRLLAFLACALTAVFVVLVVCIAWRIRASVLTLREEQAADEMHKRAERNAGQLIEEESAEGVPGLQAEILELMNKNGDAVGLMHFEGDRTLYVCQTTDNAYYASHRFDGSEEPAGMIFMDCRNSLLPRSDNLILYGHNMRDGSRFGTLKRFESWEYIRKYPVFQFIDRYKNADYVPIAVFHTSVLPDDPAYYPFDQTDFADEADFNRYIRDVKSRSIMDIPVTAEYGDSLLTLATCHSGLERGRLVIVCREKEKAPKALLPSVSAAAF